MNSFDKAFDEGYAAANARICYDNPYKVEFHSFLNTHGEYNSDIEEKVVAWDMGYSYGVNDILYSAFG